MQSTKTIHDLAGFRHLTADSIMSARSTVREIRDRAELMVRKFGKPDPDVDLSGCCDSREAALRLAGFPADSALFESLFGSNATALGASKALAILAAKLDDGRDG